MPSRLGAPLLASRAVVVGKDGAERRGILGVLDGFCPLGVEDEAGEAWPALLGHLGWVVATEVPTWQF